MLRTRMWLIKVQACVPHACTALCSVSPCRASIEWKGVIDQDWMNGIRGCTFIFLVAHSLAYLYTQVHLSLLKETATPEQTDAM